VAAEEVTGPLVVMLGTDPGAAGGVAAVVAAYRRSALSRRWNLRYIATHRDGGALRKLLTLAKALLTFYGLLLRGRVGLLHAHTASRASFLRKCLFVLPAYLCRVPVALHVHGAEFDRFYTRELGPLRRRLVAAVLRRADRVIVLSEFWRRFFVTVVAPERLVVLPNAVVLPELEPDRGGGAAKILLFLGRIGARKGFFELLDVLARLRARGMDVELWAGGDGELELARARARELGVEDRLRLLGWLTDEGKLTALRRAHVFCLPSQAEGLPMALLEAMAAGLPVVTSPVGGIPEAVTDGQEGFLVTPGAIDEIEQAVSRLLGDEALRRRMGAAARQRAAANYSLEAVVPALEAIYDQLQPRCRRVPVTAVAEAKPT